MVAHRSYLLPTGIGTAATLIPASKPPDPQNKLRFDETAKSRLEANRATVGSEFLANDEAQFAYRDSYRESCRAA